MWLWLQQHHVEPARWRGTSRSEIVACRENDASLLDRADARPRAAKVMAIAAAHLDKHHRTIAFTHDEINFSATASRGSIIACEQLQPRTHQQVQRLVLRTHAPGARGVRLVALRHVDQRLSVPSPFESLEEVP